MKKKTVYVVIKCKLDVDDNFDEDEYDSPESVIAQECDYSVVYDDNGVKVVGTELLGVLDHCPLGV